MVKILDFFCQKLNHLGAKDADLPKNICFANVECYKASDSDWLKRLKLAVIYGETIEREKKNWEIWKPVPIPEPL